MEALVLMGVLAVSAFVVISRISSGPYQEELARHARHGHRFLCPGCMEFGPFRYACPACGREVPPAALWEPDPRKRICRHCAAPVSADAQAEGTRPRAFCGACGGHFDAARHHEREVIVMGVFSRVDLETLRSHLARGLPNGGGFSLCLDDGRRLTYVVDLSALDGYGKLPGRHAAREIRVLWLDQATWIGKGLRGAVDQFLARADFRWPPGRRVWACLRGANADPHVVGLLVSRFGGFRTNVEPEMLLVPAARGTGQAAERTHVLGALTPGDFRTLCEAMNPTCCWNLGGGWVSEETPGRTTYLLDFSEGTPPPNAFGLTPSLSEVQAYWIGTDEPLEIGRLADRLIRDAGMTPEQRKATAVCLGAAEVDPAARRLLEARFGRIRYGVSPEGFLGGTGSGASGWSPNSSGIF